MLPAADLTDSTKNSAVEILFKTARLARVCNDLALLQKTFGRENADRIRCRLTVLEAASTLGDVQRKRPERLHPLKGELAGCYAVDVLHPFRIVFRPAEPARPMARGGKSAVLRVTAIIILEVVDYH